MSVCGQVSSWDGTRHCFMEILMYAQDIPEDWKHKHNLCTHVWIYISKVSVSYSTLHVHSVIYKPVVLVMLQDICRLVWKVAWEYWCLSNLIEMYSSSWQQFLVQCSINNGQVGLWKEGWVGLQCYDGVNSCMCNCLS